MANEATVSDQNLTIDIPRYGKRLGIAPRSADGLEGLVAADWTHPLTKLQQEIGLEDPRFWHSLADHFGHRVAVAYFAAEDDGPIKIGFTLNIKARLQNLRSTLKKDLRLLAVRSGGRQRESAYHFQFAAHRLHGEWFERHPDIVAEIDRLNADPL